MTSEMEAVRAQLRAAGVAEAELDAAPTLWDLYRLSGEIGNRPYGDPMTLHEVATAAAVPVAAVQRLLRVGGLVADELDSPVWYSTDVEWIGMIAVAEELFGADAVEMLVRRAGGAMSQLANAASSVFRASQWGDEEPTSAEIVERNLATRPLIDLYMHLCGQLYRYHSRLSFRDDSVAAGRFGELREMGVGFVDVASSTEIGGRLSAAELSRWINEFTAVAYGAATRHGARVVKTIGDEVMLCAVEPGAVVGAALDLVDYCAAHPTFSAARGGIAVMMQVHFDISPTVSAKRGQRVQMLGDRGRARMIENQGHRQAQPGLGGQTVAQFQRGQRIDPQVLDRFLARTSRPKHESSVREHRTSTQCRELAVESLSRVLRVPEENSCER